MTKLIVGLGNPGSQYAKTRHNVGFMVIDEFANNSGIHAFQNKFKGEYATTIIEGEKVYLLKPQTYMNLSGVCISQFMSYFQISDEDLIVIYDDLDTPLGKLRLREKGSAGGHNGIKSLISHLGHQIFKRIRFGIGRPEKGQVVDYVLTPFHGSEQEVLNETLLLASKAIEASLEKPFVDVMNEYNRKN